MIKSLINIGGVLGLTGIVGYRIFECQQLTYPETPSKTPSETPSETSSETSQKLPYGVSHEIKRVTGKDYLYEHQLPNQLDLTNSTIWNVKPLQNIKRLSLGSCRILTDVSSLGNLEYLDLSYTSVKDVSALGRVNHLDLSFTPVKDVSALGRVNHLNLSNTPVTDVSQLGDVHTLHLHRTKVTDVSALGRVYHLDLSNTPVKDVSALSGVEELILTGCENITDYSAVPQALR